ncbi:MAG: phosphodiester glycosidase family protein [Tissierellaceae bacterium]
MRKNITKFLLSFLALLLVLSLGTTALAQEPLIVKPSTIYQSVEKTPMGPGTVHENIKRFTSAGWWNINLLRVDLSNPYIEVRGLYNTESVGKRTRTSQLVEQNNAIGGINADFFYTGKFSGAIGSLIENGQFVTAPNDGIQEKLPGFIIDGLNQAAIVDSLQREVSLTNLKTGDKININAVNSLASNLNSITLLDRRWGEMSPGNTIDPDLIEVFVKDNTVVNVRIGFDPYPIPEDGYVLIGKGNRADKLLNLFFGSPVELKVSSNPNIEDIKFSIGGGNVILKDGKYQTLNPNSSGDPRGNHPRTAIGISKDKKELILATIDGRDSSYKGVSQSMFGAILSEFGAYDAINLDGGGSTSFALKALGEEKARLVNRPSDGGERLVINGVGVFSNAPVSELNSIEISTDDLNMFVGSSRKISLKAYDKHYNPVEVDDSLIKLEYTGSKGEIIDGSFKALETGKVRIIANYGDKSAYLDLNVLDGVKDISTSLTSFNIDVNSKRALPSFYGLDKEGNRALIYAKDMKYNIINEVGHLDGNLFHSGQEAKAGALTASFGDGLRNILVYVGNETRLLEGFESLDNLNLALYPLEVKGEINMIPEAKEGRAAAALSYDFSQGENTRAAYIRFGKGDNMGLSIDRAPKELGLWVKGDKGESWLRATVKDANGTVHKLDLARKVDWDDWKYLNLSLPAGLAYPAKLEDIYVVETDSLKKHSGEIVIDGLSALYAPSLGNIALPSPSEFKDYKNVKADLEKGGYSFEVMARPAEDGYHKLKEGNVTLIYLNTEKGGLRPTDPDQWNKLKLDLANEEQKNIVLFSPQPIFGTGGFTDQLEADLLHNYLTNAGKSGKNIFFVHGGNANSIVLKDGIRYIGVNTRALADSEDIYDIPLVEFFVNGDRISYEIKQLLQ